MAKKKKKFIKKAIKRPGALTNFAKRNKTLNKDGTINLDKTETLARKRDNTRVLRQVNLARTLRKLRK